MFTGNECSAVLALSSRGFYTEPTEYYGVTTAVNVYSEKILILRNKIIRMIFGTQIAFLYPTVLLAVLGIGHIKRPQTMFYIIHFPFGTAKGGLTKEGEQTYYYLGMFYLLLAGLLALLVLML